MRKVKKINEEVIDQNPWWIYKHDKFQKEDGSQGDYYYAETKNNTMIVPVLNDGRLVLVRQYRYLQDRESIEFPCGQLLPEEAPSEGGKRELLEETGYEAKDLIKIGNFESCKGLVKDESHIYLGMDLKQVALPQEEETGDIEVIYRRIDEMEQMISSGEIWDGQTLATWALARNHLYNLTQNK